MESGQFYDQVHTPSFNFFAKISLSAQPCSTNFGTKALFLYFSQLQLMAADHRESRRPDEQAVGFQEPERDCAPDAGEEGPRVLPKSPEEPRTASSAARRGS